jgi:hypothetical protein
MTRIADVFACGATLVLAAATGPMIGASNESFSGFPCSLDPALTCVMSGLANPRGLAFGPEGGLYVAEAGRGGDGPCMTRGGQTFCYGPTGAVSRLRHGVQERIVTELPSLARAGTGAVGVGPHDIAMLGIGRAYVTIGLESDPALRNLFPEFAAFGRLVHVTPGGQWRFVADISAYEVEHNPDGRLREDGTPFHDSNPYGLLALPGRHLVTDAGGNTLLSVDDEGNVSLLAVFHSRGTTPPRPSFAPPRPPPLPPFDEFTDAVPTSVVVGPDDAYYVSELTGVPFVDSTANIYRVPRGSAPHTFLINEACLAGFKMILDMDFDDEGNLYVLQHATGLVQQPGGGVLIKVTPDKSQADICDQYRVGTRTDVVTGLRMPTSVAVGPDGALYISNRGLSGVGGEVVRIDR